MPGSGPESGLATPQPATPHDRALCTLTLTHPPAQRAPHGVWGAVAPCLAPEAKMLRGIGEDLARYYVGSVVLALEHLHAKHIVYRDLKVTGACAHNK